MEMRVWFTQPIGNDRTRTVNAEKFFVGQGGFVFFQRSNRTVMAVKGELVALIETLGDRGDT